MVVRGRASPSFAACVIRPLPVASLVALVLCLPVFPAQDAGTSIGPAQVSRIFLDLTLEPSVPIPSSLAHRFGITLAARDGDTTAATVVSGGTPVSPDAAVVLDPPLAGRRWLVGGGCCFPPSYHRTATLPVNGAFHAAQRFAVDFVQLDAEGQLFTGPREDLQSYAYYGATIHAAGTDDRLSHPPRPERPFLSAVPG